MEMEIYEAYLASATCSYSGIVVLRNNLVIQEIKLQTPGHTQHQQDLNAIIYLLRKFPRIAIKTQNQLMYKGFTQWMYNWHNNGWARDTGQLAHLNLWMIIWELKDNVTIQEAKNLQLIFKAKQIIVDSSKKSLVYDPFAQTERQEDDQNRHQEHLDVNKALDQQTSNGVETPTTNEIETPTAYETPTGNENSLDKETSGGQISLTDYKPTQNKDYFKQTFPLKQKYGKSLDKKNDQLLLGMQQKLLVIWKSQRIQNQTLKRRKNKKR